MIHLLEINPTQTPKEVYKLARRQAMTGGFELGIQQGLTQSEVEHIRVIWGTELDALKLDNSQKKNSIAYRIVALISDKLGPVEQASF